MEEKTLLEINFDKLINSNMIKEYIEEMKNVFLNLYPGIDEEKLEKIIKNRLAEKVKNVPIVSFTNNYTKVEKNISLLSWYDWYKKTEPITTEHGVCFKNHNKSVNLSAKLLEYILDTRKYHKKKMFECKKGGDHQGEKYHNIRQKVFKIFANSYYGATGNSKSIFYNLFTALSITGKGQSLITNAALSFEMFFADNFVFSNISDLLFYVNNIKNEKRKLKDSVCLTKQIKESKLVDRLISKFENKDMGLKYKSDIEKIVSNLSKTERNRVYYKNNFFEFCKCEKVIKYIFEILNKTDKFRDPNEVPDIIKDDMEKLWSWLEEFVYYPYSRFDRISICKNLGRKAIITVDTDSNMVNTEPWIDFLIEQSNGIFDKETIEAENIFKMVNILAFILGHMIGEVHERYGIECNVPEEKRSIINMKNEFLNRRMLLTESKKNYASIILLQEGANVPDNEALDIKGLTIKKSNVNKNIGNELQSILEQDILRANNISISKILKRLVKLQNNIQDSFNKGEVYYAKPDKSNEPITYKTPYQIQAVRGILAWNSLYPDKEITFPAQVNTIKLKINSIDMLEKYFIFKDGKYIPYDVTQKEEIKKELAKNKSYKLIKPVKKTNPEIYESIAKNIFAIDIRNSVNKFINTSEMIKLKNYDKDVYEKSIDSYVKNSFSGDAFTRFKLSKYGFGVIAIPKTEEYIPKWLLPFIDTDKIIADGLTNFNKIFESVGVKTINTSSTDSHYSNIIDF